MLLQFTLYAVYNVDMSNDVLETDFLFQPRGAGTGWCFRMRTPDILIGYENPRTNKPYGNEIREGLATRNLREARRERDILLGKIKAEAAKVLAEKAGDVETALAYAEDLEQIDDPKMLETVELALTDKAERIEKASGTQQAKQWYQAATGTATPASLIYEKYVANRSSTLSVSLISDLRTAWNDFEAFAGKGISIEAVDRRMVATFVTEYLPSKKNTPHPRWPQPCHH